MTTLTKLLAAEAKPAKPILDRAHQLVLTTEQRKTWTEGIETAEGKIEVAVNEERPLFVGDVLLDDQGAFWVVRPAVEKVVRVTGDLRTMQEAAGALINRGVDIAQTEDGFAVLALPNIAKMLEMIGLEVKEVEAEFDPIRIERHAQAGGCGCSCSCGCGGHDHGDACGCGGEHHHHHHDEHECCCGGEHHHHEEHECCCGGEHQHQHGHEEGCTCGCGGHHHHHNEEKHYKY